MPCLARAYLLSPLGLRLVRDAGDDADRPGPLDLLLLDDDVPDSPLCYVLDIRSGNFLGAGRTTVAEAIDAYPFGLVVRTMDLAAVLRGELQIWDIVGVTMRSWYPGADEIDSPVAVLYEALGEQIRPDIACCGARKSTGRPSPSPWRTP